MNYRGRKLVWENRYEVLVQCDWSVECSCSSAGKGRPTTCVGTSYLVCRLVWRRKFTVVFHQCEVLPEH